MEKQEKKKRLDNSEEIILVEWPNDQGRIQKASREGEIAIRLQNQAERAINIAMGNIRAMARHVAQTMNQLEDKARPDEVEVEFGINLDAEAGALLAKASSGAQLKVALKWSIEQPDRPKIFVSSSD